MVGESSTTFLDALPRWLARVTLPSTYGIDIEFIQLVISLLKCKPGLDVTAFDSTIGSKDIYCDFALTTLFIQSAVINAWMSTRDTPSFGLLFNHHEFHKLLASHLAIYEQYLETGDITWTELHPIHFLLRLIPFEKGENVFDKLISIRAVFRRSIDGNPINDWDDTVGVESGITRLMRTDPQGHLILVVPIAAVNRRYFRVRFLPMQLFETTLTRRWLSQEDFLDYMNEVGLYDVFGDQGRIRTFIKNYARDTLAQFLIWAAIAIRKTFPEDGRNITAVVTIPVLSDIGAEGRTVVMGGVLNTVARMLKDDTDGEVTTSQKKLSSILRALLNTNGRLSEIYEVIADNKLIGVLDTLR